MEQIPLRTYREVIELWPSAAALARFLGSKPHTVAEWWRRDSVPESKFMGIVEAAQKCGFEGVSYALLARFTPGAALQDSPQG